MTTVSNEHVTAETPKNAGVKREWTAEQRLALRILGRLGYEGDLLNLPAPSVLNERLAIIFNILVEEITEGFIHLGAPGLGIDETISCAEDYRLGRQYVKPDGAE